MLVLFSVPFIIVIIIKIEEIENKLNKYPFIIFQFKDKVNDKYKDLPFKVNVPEYGINEFKTDSTELGQYWKLTFGDEILEEFPILLEDFVGIVTVKKFIKEFHINYDYSDNPEEMLKRFPHYYYNTKRKNNFIGAKPKKQLTNGAIQTVGDDRFVNVSFK
ncbi:hypothetical protein ABK040_006489 [Willaertia magna]